MGANSGKERKTRGAGSRNSLSKEGLEESIINCPLIHNLTPDLRKKMEASMIRKTYRPGQNIIKQGDAPDGFYIIEYGEAEVIVKDSSSGRSSKTVATLSVGDYFGERALVTKEVRGATIRTTDETQCLFFPKEKFVKLFGDSNDMQHMFPKRVAVCAEGTNTLTSLAYKPKVHELKKSEEQKQRIAKALRNNAFFSQYEEEHLLGILAAMYKQDIKSGDAPIKQGETGDQVYIVERGTFEVTIKDKGKTSTVDIVKPGRVFGELALMYNSPRLATVTATEDSSVWVIDRFTFRKIVLNTSEERLVQFKKFLKKVPLLKKLTNMEREKVAEALDEIHVKKGQTIVKEGDLGDCMFIVRTGCAIAQKAGEVETIEYKSGDYFGELVLKDKAAKNRRQATVVAKSSCVLLKLSKVAVNLLLGPVEEIMKKRMSRYSSSSLQKMVPIESKTALGTMTQIPFKNLRIIGRLGNGAFGLVRLVEDDRNPGQTYALKAVSKLKVVRSKQESHLINERRILLRVKHPYVTRLYDTYQDDRSVYFLLEPCLGGELFTILRSRTSFSERTSQYYAATVVEIFDYLQQRNIVYRDLKPENLLLDSKGNLKMTDFGFAKTIHGKTYTLCGTPDYLAPEIVVGKGHGKAVDWWTLGVLIYEMIAGYPPFYASKPMKTYAKILHAKVKYPTHFSSGAIQIISELLNRKPSERLGVTHGGAKTVRKQKFFKGFDFKGLMDGKLRPPILPKVKSTTDIGNFRAGRKKDPEPPQYNGKQDWCKEF